MKILFLLILLSAPSNCASFGAIAIDINSESSAYAVNFSTISAAITRINEDCDSCDIVKTFKNSCAAMAKGYGGYGWGIAKSLSIAKKTAIDSCVNNNGKFCTIRAFGCDFRA